MKRWMTTSNVLATIAVACALGGATMVTSWAATTTQYTGAQVKDSSLTGKDVQDRSLSSSDFTAAARTSLKAQVGPTGATGAQGQVGSKGATGSKGAAGVSAARSYSYITADDTTSFLKPKTGTYANPKSPLQQCSGKATTLPATIGWEYQCDVSETFFPHWAYDCGSVPEYYCNLGSTIGSAGAGATRLANNSIGAISFTGDENGSFVSLMGPGNIIVTGSATLLRGAGGYHSRVSCQPRVRRSNSSDAYTYLGTPTVVSGFDHEQVVHVTVTGGTRLAEAGDYDYEIACRLVDEHDSADLSDDWMFVSGNATATTTEL